jgi:hypothetical protein
MVNVAEKSNFKSGGDACFPSEFENGAAGKPVTCIGRPQAERMGCERIKSRGKTYNAPSDPSTPLRFAQDDSSCREAGPHAELQ